MWQLCSNDQATSLHAGETQSAHSPNHSRFATYTSARICFRIMQTCAVLLHIKLLCPMLHCSLAQRSAAHHVASLQLMAALWIGSESGRLHRLKLWREDTIALPLQY